MTALVDRPGTGPQTHALVIGVGEYRHLNEPRRPRVQALGLASLSSPPASALAFTDWLLGDLHNDAAPLGSVELLLSAPTRHYRSPNGAVDVGVEAATMANITAAWDRWFERCDRHTDNVAIFYWCGHGVKKMHLSLLAEDFGEDERRLLEHAVDIDASHNGMASTCKARVQCFFVDACRQVAYSEVGMLTGDGQVLADQDLTSNCAEEAPRFFATLPTDPAYGQTGETTLFTGALLDALHGPGAGLMGGKWVVHVGALLPGINVALERRRRAAQAPPQIARQGGEMVGRAIVHELAGEPLVPVIVAVAPEDASAAAELSLESIADPALHHERAPTLGPWELDVRFGYYRGRAHFPGGAYPDYAWEGTVFPPQSELPWVVG